MDKAVAVAPYIRYYMKEMFDIPHGDPALNQYYGACLYWIMNSRCEYSLE